MLKMTAVALALAACTMYAQTAAPTMTLPPGTVVTDGSVSPGAISDAVALRMLYAMATPKTSSSTTVTRSVATFLSDLKASDRQVMLNHIGAWVAKVPATIPNAKTAEEVRAMIDAELLALHASMTPDGWKALEAELNRRKAHIKIFQVPEMAMPGGK